MTVHIRQFRWSDHDAVVAVWTAAGRDVLPRAELEAKLTRDPELFLVTQLGGEAVAVTMKHLTGGGAGSCDSLCTRPTAGRVSPPGWWMNWRAAFGSWTARG